MGMTPLGYRREYPPPLPNGRRPAGKLAIDEATAPLVRELFRRYADGGWSIRKLATWLNTSDPRIPSPKGSGWTSSSILRMLHNPVYIGKITYNRMHQGLYERATDAEFFITDGRHEALIDDEIWHRVQGRLAAAAQVKSFNRQRTVTGRPVALGSGILRCAECGANMLFHYSTKTGRMDYQCYGRRSGKTACTASAYKASLGDDALLAELRRLHGAPWTPQGEARLLGSNGEQADRVLRQQKQLEAERERMRKHVRRMSLLQEDPSAEEIAAFREISAEISARIRVLETELAEQDSHATHIPTLREIHARLTQAEIPALIDNLVAQHDQAGLRELVLSLVTSARLVTRWPERIPAWARAEVTWAADVQTLLDAGLLRLGPVPDLTAEMRAAIRKARTQRAVEMNAVRWASHAKGEGSEDPV
jgi:hypothetical protein